MLRKRYIPGICGGEISREGAVWQYNFTTGFGDFIAKPEWLLYNKNILNKKKLLTINCDYGNIYGHFQ